jgi:glutamate N-acetyltransferase / amino-acid N-acetyltransferase
MYKVNGFEFSGINAGIKKEKKDLGLIFCKDGATFAGVFTKNKFASPTISFAKNILKNKNNIKAVLVNSGNANCLTGEKGLRDIKEILSELNYSLKINENDSISLSTGIIGKPLPVDIIKNAMSVLFDNISENAVDFTKAIMTTDTIDKVVSKTVEINGKKINILGIAKGSGMIQPNMATMLSFILTDAAVEQPLLQAILEDAVNKSFNAITVDSDSSTNDSCLLLSSNKGAALTDENKQSFTEAVREVSQELAKLIIIDAEGATKFVTLQIKNAFSEQEAKKIFYAIANSPLVKTAIFGENPNFGRILCSAGKIDSNIIPEKLSLFLGDFLLYDRGVLILQKKEDLNNYMKQKNIYITLDLGIGKHSMTGWTSDLSYEYVKINAEYN